MSLVAFSSLMHLNSKDNSHRKNERSVFVLFLFFVARFSVFSILGSIILPKFHCLNESGKGRMSNVPCLRHKLISPAFESFHFVVNVESLAVMLYLPYFLGQRNNLLTCASCQREETLGKRLTQECRSWQASMSLLGIKAQSWHLPHIACPG